MAATKKTDARINIKFHTDSLAIREATIRSTAKYKETLNATIPRVVDNYFGLLLAARARLYQKFTNTELQTLANNLVDFQWTPHNLSSVASHFRLNAYPTLTNRLRASDPLTLVALLDAVAVWKLHRSEYKSFAKACAALDALSLDALV